MRHPTAILLLPQNRQVVAQGARARALLAVPGLGLGRLAVPRRSPVLRGSEEQAEAPNLTPRTASRWVTVLNR